MPADRRAESATVVEKPPWLLEVGAIILLIVNTALAGLTQATSVKSLAELIGAMLGPALFVIVLIGVVRLFKGARTRRGVAQIAVVTLSLTAIGQCGSLGRQARPVVSQDELETQRAAAVARVVAEVSKTLPRRVDDDTVLFKVAADGANLVYSYRFVNMVASDVEPEKIASLVVQRACGEGATRDHFLKQGIGMRYTFYDETGTVSSPCPSAPTTASSRRPPNDAMRLPRGGRRRMGAL